MILLPQMPMDHNTQRLFKQGLRVPQNSPETDTRLHKALTDCCKYDEVERLLALGAPASDQNTEGDTAVHVAFLNCASGRIVDLLLMSYLRETRKNLKNEYGLSVLHIACSRRHLEIVEKLAEWNWEDVNCQSDVLSSATTAGCTPLHMAVEYDRYDIAKYLLKTCKVDFCVQNKYGSTSLHIALDRRSLRTIDLILAHNHCYEDIADDSGLTHFMAACAGTSIRVVTYFLNHEKTWSSKKALIDAQVDEDIPEYHFAGYTALHFAAEFGRYDVMKVLLLYCGASCFTENFEGLTPLVLAVRRRYCEIARLLMQFYRMYSRALFAEMNIDDRKKEETAIVNDLSRINFLSVR